MLLTGSTMELLQSTEVRVWRVDTWLRMGGMRVRLVGIWRLLDNSWKQLDYISLNYAMVMLLFTRGEILRVGSGGSVRALWLAIMDWMVFQGLGYIGLEFTGSRIK